MNMQLNWVISAGNLALPPREEPLDQMENLVGGHLASHLSKRNLVGSKFGRLTVVSSASNQRMPNGRTYVCWNCLCECGNNKIVKAAELFSGDTKSCGCIHTDSQWLYKHGNSKRKSKTKEYIAWNQMISRCHSESSSSYKNYGARGISVCDKWRESFVNFIEDMGPRPAGMSIDRIDNEKGYFKENCKWSTKKEQSNNRRTNKIVEYNGERLTISQWAEKTGIKYGLLYSRYANGWTPYQIFTYPKKQKRAFLEK